MELVKPALLYFLLPFVLVTLLYHIVDKRGERTAKLFKKPGKMPQKVYDTLIKQRLSIQFLLTLVVVLVMMVLAVKLRMRVWLFYLISGVLIGLINSVGLALSRNLSGEK